ADFHALDDVDRCCQPEILHEPRVVVYESAVGRAAVASDIVHDANPTGVTGVGRAGQRGCESHGAHSLFERAQGNAAQAVLRVDDLALFRHAEPPTYRSCGRAQNGARDLATAAAD